LRRTDEDELTQAILALAAKYGRYGYRRITVLLQGAGWPVGKDRVQRIWRREGLKVPQKQRARGRLWLGDGSCVRLRPERANHVWSYDFVKAMTHDGRALRILVVIDEYTRECLALRVARRLGSLQVIETLADVMLVRGIPEHIRSDRAGVHCRRVAEVARETGHEDVVHRAWESMGERVLREFQREVER
jgi:transposase InsO family protein